MLGLSLSCSGPTTPTPTTPIASPAPSRPPNSTPTLTITCPPNITASTTAGSVPVTFATPTTNGGVAPVQVSCTRQSGSQFAVGTTPVQCTATDAAASWTSCVFSVTVTALVPRLTRTRFLAFGDSMTSGEITVPAGTSSAGQHIGFIVVPAASYPTQLATQLRARYTDQASAIQVINSGVPGEWAQDGFKRLPGVMRSVLPEAVLLLEGYNDLGATGSAGITAAIIALDGMAKEVRNRGARLFIATLPPPGAGAKGIPASQVILLNDRIRTLAAGEGAVLVDAFSEISKDVPRYVGVDGLHLTEAGYQRLAEIFFAAIRSEFEAR